MPTKKRGIAFKIYFCWDLTAESDTKTPLADVTSLAVRLVADYFGLPITSVLMKAPTRPT
jgi:hypothetical protein